MKEVIRKEVFELIERKKITYEDFDPNELNTLFWLELKKPIKLKNKIYKAFKQERGCEKCLLENKGDCNNYVMEMDGEILTFACKILGWYDFLEITDQKEILKILTNGGYHEVKMIRLGE